jgi:hypothetical protein
MRRLGVGLGLGVLLTVVPRVARADLYLNVDSRFEIWGDKNKQCKRTGYDKGVKTYNCKWSNKGDGTVTFSDQDGTVCVLSIWTSGTNETWHADIKADAKYPKSVCRMRWENGNTLKVYPG